LTQVVDVDEVRTLAMVEIRAERDGRTLHNFAGFLVVVRDGVISELWMVDAKPAESDLFWR
jgi:ketosteroid isomerase-like protein